MKRRTHVSFARLAGGAAITALALTALAGCDGGDAEALLGATTGEEARSGAGFAAPEMDELRAELELTDAQVTALTPALASWQAAIAERHAARDVRRAHRAEGRESPRGDRSHGPRGMEARIQGGHERPGAAFIAESGRVLAPEQMIALAELLAERHDARASRTIGDRGGRHGRHGRHAHAGGPREGVAPLGGALHLAMREIGADRETMRELHATMRAQHDAVRPVWAAYRAGEASAEALRDALGAARLTMEKELAGHLDPDQQSAVESAIAGMRERVASRRLDALDARLERRVSFLAGALNLDGDAEATVRAIVTDVRPRVVETIESAASGAIAIEEAVYRTLTLRADTQAKIRAALTEEQAGVFDALLELVPHD